MIFLERDHLLFRIPTNRTVGFRREQEGKLLYAARTTRTHQFGGVPTTQRGRDIFLLVLIFG